MIQIIFSTLLKWDYKGIPIETLKKIWKFLDDETLYYAASLSFFTIFALLPILALVISFMSTHPMFEANKDLLIMFVLDFVNPTHSEALSQNIQNFLVNSSSLGTFGLIYLVVIFTMFFQDFEHIVNKIHNTQKRGLIPTFLLYLSFIIIIPFFLAIFTYISAFLPDSTSKIILSFLFGLSFVTLIFVISVNSKISFKAALISAFITVNVLKFTQFVFSYYVLYNEAIGTIYGAFSVVFFMFLWLYLSWIIYLYGVKICYLINKRVLNT